MYEKVKTVKVNLKDIEKQKTPSKKESNQKQKWNSSSKNKYSPESNISKVNGLDSYQAYDNGDIIINRRREEDEAIRKILENPQHDKAFLEALMKRYDSGIKKVEIEITEAKEREIKELKSRNETLQQERDELYSENEKLRKTRDIINQELSQVREALVKARSECRMLEDTVSDMEELIKKQEDIHYMEMKKLEREMESKIALNVKQEKDLLISEKASGSPSEKKSEFIKNKKVFKKCIRKNYFISYQ
jgi:chromosome segregation ATPase